MSGNKVHRLPRLGLGEAKRLYGMTARAIRFYEERGLVEARRDRLNHRFYDEAACERLSWISRLRQAGVSIPDIEAVLTALGRGESGRDQALAKLRDRRAAMAGALQRIEEAAQDIKASPPAPRVVRTLRG